MGRSSLDFLTESILWSDVDQEELYAALSEDELKAELARYRAYVLSQPVAAAGGLAATLSARERSWNDSTVKRSALYFDEVLLPDPVLDLIEWTREDVIAFHDEPSRAEIVTAVRRMRALVPLVRLDRVRFIPSTVVLEPPARQLLLYSEDNFESEVPPDLRAWFRARADLRKVVVDDRGRRLVLLAPPDLETSSIQVDFGQLGHVHTYDHMQLLELNVEDRSFRSAQMQPVDEASLRSWLEQSVNRSAGGLLNDTLADAELAWKLGSSLVTSCAVAAELLERLAIKGSSRQHSAGLAVKLPMVEGASVEQIADLIEKEPIAFEAFRFELRALVATVREIDDPAERAVRIRAGVEKLANEQVHAVDCKVREARLSLKWDVPITAIQLAAGLVGLFAGDPTLAGLTAGFLTGGAQAMSAVKKHREHHALPGYFLWKLERGS